MLVNQDERKLTQFTGWLCSNLTYLHFKKSYIALYQHLCQHHMDAKMINVSKSIAYTRKKIDAYEVFRLDMVMGWLLWAYFEEFPVLTLGICMKISSGIHKIKRLHTIGKINFPTAAARWMIIGYYRYPSLLSYIISFFKVLLNWKCKTKS